MLMRSERESPIGFFSVFDTENHDIFTSKEEQDSPLTNTQSVSPFKESCQRSYISSRKLFNGGFYTFLNIL